MESKQFVFFGASWCGACKRFLPVATEELEKRTDFLTYTDIEESEEAMALAQRLNVRNLPTLALVGDPSVRLVGYHTPDQTRDWLERIGE